LQNAVVMEIADTFDFLLGRWSLDRTLTDCRAADLGSFHGTGELRTATPASECGRDCVARYQELGRLRYGSYDGTARRTLDYLRTDSGAVVVNFSDGRRYIGLDLRNGVCQAEHPCGDDLYEIGFRVCAEELMEERRRVRGPRKNYDACTGWQRIASTP
jgi:hypothetical protein